MGALLHWLYQNCTGNWVAGISQDAVFFGLGWFFSKEHRKRLREHRDETLQHLKEHGLLLAQVHSKVHESASDTPAEPAV